MPLDTTKALCTQCGTEFSRDQLTPVMDALVCERCLPGYIEYLRLDKPARGFLFSAVDPDGKKVTEYIDAANLGAARYLLDMRGYRDIVFHEDDISSAASRLFSDQGDQPQMRGDEYLNLTRNRSELYAFWLYLKNNAFLNVLMLAVLVAALYRGNPTHWSAILAYIYFTLIIGFYVMASMPLKRYNRLLEAVEWGRWDEVEKRIEGIRNGNRYALAKVPEFELDVRQAQVLASRGQTDEGLSLLKKYENDPVVEPFLYHSRRSAVYSTANDYDNYLAETLKSAELAPTSGSMQVDVALAYVMARQDAPAAQMHLDKAREMALPDTATLWLHMVQGIIHLEEGRLEQASEELTEAAGYVEKFRAMPFMTSVGYIVMTYQALTAAAQGDQTRASSLYTQARPWLIAANEARLLARGDQAIGTS